MGDGAVVEAAWGVPSSEPWARSAKKSVAVIAPSTWAWVLTPALALRAIWGLAVPVQPISDSAAYDALAQVLAFHGTYGWTPGQPSSVYVVGTSFIYAVLYRVFGHQYGPIVVFNALVGVAIVALTVLLARRWFGRDPAIIAGLLVGAWPSFVQLTTILASELPFALLLLAAFFVFLDDRRPWLGAIAGGALLAAACYFRPTALLLAPVFGFIAWSRGRPWRLSAWTSAAAVVVFAVCLAPWSVRNTRAFGRFVLVSTNSGMNLWMGNNPETKGFWMEPPVTDGLNEAERDEHLTSLARVYIREHPAAFLRRTAVKLVRLHERESIGVVWNPGLAARWGDPTAFALKLASNVYWWLVLALALLGAGRFLRSHGWRALAAPPILIWGYFASIHAVTVACDRYHLPIDPFIAMAASLAIAAMARAAGPARETPAREDDRPCLPSTEEAGQLQV